MKIAVSSTGQTLESVVEPRFGRCPFFLIVNPDTLEFEVLSNAGAEQSGGAGIASAQLIADKGASVVLTGSCGPNAQKVFDKIGVQVVTNVTGSVSQAVQQFVSGSLRPAPSDQNAPYLSGKTGRGMGGGRGIAGGGRGMGGGGRGRGLGGGGRGMGGGGRGIGRGGPPR